MTEMEQIKEQLVALREQLKEHNNPKAQAALRKIIYKIEMLESDTSGVPQSALDLARWLTRLADAEHGTLIKRYPRQPDNADATQIEHHVEDQRTRLHEGATLHSEVTRGIKHMAGMLGVNGAQAVETNRKIGWLAEALLTHLQHQREAGKQLHEMMLATMGSLQAMQEMLVDMGEESPELRQVAIMLAQPVPENPLEARDHFRRINADLKQVQRTIQQTGGRLKHQLDGSMEAFADITQKLAREQQQTRSDALTGLPNRRALKEHLSTQAGDAVMTLAMIDIDGLRQINNRLGESAGDQLLREIADRIGARIRAEDMLFRIGGDEFMVLLSAVHGEGALQAALGLCSCITQPAPKLAGKKVRVTITIGLAERHQGEKLHAWLKRSDAALYVAKGHGGNRAELAP
ncbi:MAG: GGDEF domain-containing protein [Mariprofundales bacterium]